MGYQALLFCPDEKLARVVTQVFTELDFSVETVSEPFSTVKKLMTKRYDALVVDCEHEQNAALLFKSARNSGNNQKTLAIAVVEGQAGVAKAYRIGANLVLTKPINVEQAKGTLRVARGLLRKNAEAATNGAVTPGPAAQNEAGPERPTSSESQPVSASAAWPAAADKNAQDLPEFEPSLPAAAATTKPAEIADAVPAPAARTTVSIAAESAPPAAQPTPAKIAPAATAAPAPMVAAVPDVAQFPKHSAGSAAAPAPAREPVAPVPSQAAQPEVKHSEAKQSEVKKEAAASSAFAPSAEQVAAPAFAALQENAAAEAAGGSKRILAIAAALILAAALGYFGWTKFGHPPATAPQPASGQTPAPVPAPPISAAAVPTSVPAGSVSQPSEAEPQTAKPSANVPTSGVTRVSADSNSAPAKPEPTPIRVKSTPHGVKEPAQTEEAPPQAPSLAASLGNDKGLSLVTSVPATLPTKAVETLRISQGVSQGLLIKRMQPQYPKNAISMHLEGAVQLEATIDKQGQVTNIKVLNGDKMLARAATDAVRQWRYKPYFLNGQPVEIQTQITVNFKLPN